MKNLNLYNLWQAAEFNDNSLAKNSISVRLPTHIVARISAISKLFPNKSRSEIITDILKAGLIEFEKSLPEPTVQKLTAEEGKEVLDFGEYPENYVQPYGVKVDYYNYANQQYIELEKERGNQDAKAVFKIKS
jgi:hypothetical protein